VTWHSFLASLGRAVVVEGGGRRLWTRVGVGGSGDAAMLGGRCGRQVVVEDNQGIGLLMTQIDHWQTPTIDLGVVCENGFRSGHSVMIPSG
jgi:hypothetical protein